MSSALVLRKRWSEVHNLEERMEMFYTNAKPWLGLDSSQVEIYNRSALRKHLFYAAHYISTGDYDMVRKLEFLGGEWFELNDGPHPSEKILKPYY